MIIPVHHIFAINVPIAASTTIEPGMVVALDTNGYAIKCDGDAGNTTAQPIGLAADRNRASEAYEWVNRVSDSGNDTAGSGEISVYQGAGSVFYVDVDDSRIATPGGTTISGVIVSTATTTPGTVLRVDDTAAKSGQIDSAGSGTAIAVVLEAAASLDSGIPGESEPGSSVAYDSSNTDENPRQFVKIKLTI